MIKTLSRINADPYCLQEVRRLGGFVRIIESADSYDEILWIGNDSGSSHFVQIGVNFT